MSDDDDAKTLESDANRAAREEAEARINPDDDRIREETNQAFAEPAFQPAAVTQEVHGERGARIDDRADDDGEQAKARKDRLGSKGEPAVVTEAKRESEAQTAETPATTSVTTPTSTRGTTGNTTATDPRVKK